MNGNEKPDVSKLSRTDFVMKKIVFRLIPFVAVALFCTIDYSLRTIDGRTTWVVIYFIYAGIPLVIALVKIIADIIDRIELKYRSKHFPEKVGLSDDIPEQQPSPEKFRVSLKKKYAPEPTEDNEALLRYRMTGYEQAKGRQRYSSRYLSRWISRRQYIPASIFTS